MSSTLGHFFQIFENPVRRIEHLGTLAGNHAERRRAEALHQSEAGEPTVADLAVIPACAFENRLTPFVSDAEDRAALLVELLFLFICHVVGVPRRGVQINLNSSEPYAGHGGVQECSCVPPVQY